MRPVMQHGNTSKQCVVRHHNISRSLRQRANASAACLIKLQRGCRSGPLRRRLRRRAIKVTYEQCEAAIYMRTLICCKTQSVAGLRRELAPSLAGAA